MPSKTVANHLHRYKKKNLGRNGKEYLVYMCTKPACSHYITVEASEGKLCECNRCGEAMIIGRETLTKSSGRPMTLPHCVECIKRKVDKHVDTITEFIERTKPQVSVDEEI
jgi:hypothetical protein